MQNPFPNFCNCRGIGDCDGSCQHPPPAQPTAWAYELASAITANPDGSRGAYCNWKPFVSFTKPNVPNGAVRNLRPLFAGSIEPQS